MNEVRVARRDFLKCLPSGGVIAEIGVWRGIHGRDMWDLCSPASLYLVDPWQWNTQWHRTHYEGTVEHLAEDAMKITKERFEGCKEVSFVRKESGVAAQGFENGFFDWVYIDGDHRFEEAKRDMEVWWPKIKPGGYLTGHDFLETVRENSLKTLNFPTEFELRDNGVTKALLGFMEDQSLTLAFLSKGINKPNGSQFSQCWAIKKNNDLH